MKTYVLVMMSILLLAVSVQGAEVGDQTQHMAFDIGFSMRLAPAATFPIGADDSGEASVDTPFWIAETQVTYELWYMVLQWALRQGYQFANLGREGSDGNTGQAPSGRRQEPVTVVSWRDCIVWTNALSEMLGYDPAYTYQGSIMRDSSNAVACDNAVLGNTNGFRLPTSEEWELAARYQGNDSSYGAILRGGLYWTPGSYASGAKASTSYAGATEEVAWCRATSGGRTRDVGLLLPNGLGIYDMSGNVVEWTSTLAAGATRVERGGSWYSFADRLQIAYVYTFFPGNVNDRHGFRLARTEL